MDILGGFTIYKMKDNCYNIRIGMTGEYVFTTDTYEKAKAIIKILNKQIIEFPIMVNAYTGIIWLCPNCKYKVENANNYCKNCGQKLM